MKYLRRFNETHFDLADDIAKDLLPRLEEMRNRGELVTVEFFEKYMKERGAKLNLSDAVLSSLVNMGFDFDTDESEEEFEDIEDGDYVSFEKWGPLYVLSTFGDGYLVSNDEGERYKGDDGDGFLIPINTKGTVLEKG